MRLLILAVLFAVAQAAPPVPRQTPNGTARGSDSIKQNATDKQAPTSAPTVKRPVAAEENQHPAAEPSPNNAPETIIIRESVPVSVGKGWWDRFSVIFTGVLVLIGGLGVCAALRTLKAIEKQTNIMDIALKVVEAADVGIESASLVPAGKITPDSHIGIRLKNFGRTRAENVKSYVITIIPECPNSEPSPDTFSIAAGGTQLIGFLNFSQFLKEETFRKIENGTIPVRFSGKVTYGDRFGDSHEFECNGVLDPKTGTFVLGDIDPRNQNQNPNQDLTVARTHLRP